VPASETENPEALHQLALEASKNGDYQKAHDYLQRAILADPLTPEYRVNLGVILEALNQPADAIESYRYALDLHPDFPDAQTNLGNALSRLEKWLDAIAAYRAALAHRPSDPQLHNSLGVAFYRSNQLEPALEQFAAAIELRPNFPEAYNNVGNALSAKGDFELAITAYQKAVGLNPNLIDAQINLAGLFDRLDRREESFAIHHRIVAAQPSHAPSYLAIGNACLTARDLDGAVAAYRRAVELRPDSYEALNNLSVALKEQSLMDDALDACEKAMELRPHDAAIHSNLVYLLSFHPGYDAPEIARQQRRWSQQHAEPLKHLIRPHDNNSNPDRPLRIGYVSPDLFRHVVGQNLLPLLAEHDRQHFSLFCYSSTAYPDSFTQILRSNCEVWRDVAHQSDDELAEIIRQDQIDILIDLSLHMANNRLLVFARKPAPVQITYLGYCASTGMDQIDYRFSDPHLDPPDSDLSLYSEETIHLPESYWCYNPAGPTPEPSPSPFEKAGHITFACLNNFAKVSPGTLDLWAEILRSCAKSRLIIHSNPGSHVEQVRQRFAKNGVSADRIGFVAKQSWTDYIKTYSRIDIALDPFPYGGGITTCDALWLGVPVVSLIGQTAVGRGGKSILSNIGLPELATRRPRQYVQTALTLADSPARLAELRRALRHRLLTSPLMNARKFTRSVEATYRNLWRRWCANPT
jgi:predicted O-linked N-acetylglucosamine transferase (SPINDLY family)